MKRRWIVLGFLVVAVALGAWLIFSGKPAGRVSIRFLGYHTNDANERSIVLWITNGHDYPVECLCSALRSDAFFDVPEFGQKQIAPHSALSQHALPGGLTQISAGICQLKVVACQDRANTRTEMLRLELGNWLIGRGWESLGDFVAPMRCETVLSEPIVLPPEARQD